MDRIFTVCHVTQLMVVLHLRRHRRLPKAREFLVWHPMVESSPMERFMREVIPAAGFDAILDIRGFESLRPRTQGPLSWWFESARRLRADAGAVRGWLEQHNIDEANAELWADDPIHFNVLFFKQLLHGARQIKFPHGFNLEDSTSPAYMERLTAKLRGASFAKRALFFPWLKLISGVDCGLDRSLGYAESYTFDQSSCWAPESIDVSRLVSIEAFKETYASLPQTIRREVEALLAPINAAAKPVVLLLLFGLSPSARAAYQNAMSRVFQDRQSSFEQHVLLVKTHPAAADGGEEELFFRWLESASPCKVHVLRHPLNLEFLLPLIELDSVLAGPCGALPMLRRVKSGRPVVLPEITDELIKTFPDDRDGYEKLVAGIEAW